MEWFAVSISICGAANPGCSRFSRRLFRVICESSTGSDQSHGRKGVIFRKSAKPGGHGANNRAASDATVITRAFSGRPARGLANAFTTLLAGNENAILPYPLQNVLTRAMRAAAAAQGNAEVTVQVVSPAVGATKAPQPDDGGSVPRL